MKNIRLGIVVSDFNKEITSNMEKNAENTAKQLSAKIIICMPSVPLVAPFILTPKITPVTKMTNMSIVTMIL